MSSRTVTLEHALYALALAIALGLRFLHLGALPLTDFEAEGALQALAIVEGDHPALGPTPAYLHLTAILFALFGASDFWARFWPALAGSALVLAPWFLRRRLGRVAALVLAFGWALDPGLNALSRQADGPMLAITFLILTIVFWLEGRRALAGIFGGLTLLAGPSAWFGLLGLALGWGFSRLFPAPLSLVEAEAESAAGETGAGSRSAPVRLESLRPALGWGAGTFLVVGTLFLFSPQGLAAFAASFIAFLRGWVMLSDVSLGRLFLALPAYELLPLTFGLWAAGRVVFQKDAARRPLAFWALGTFVLTVIYPGHQVSDWGWLLLPLWALAAVEVARHFDFEGYSRWVVGGTMFFVWVLAVITWMMMTRLTTIDLTNPAYRWQWLILLILPLVGVILILLVGTGWSAEEARLGAVWGVLVPLVFFTLSTATGAAQIREPRTLELWYPEPRLGRAELLRKVANELSLYNTGVEADLPLTIVGVDSAALRWMFRDWQVDEVPALAPDQTTALVITPSGLDLTLTADYRGAPFVWREKGDWQAASVALWYKWFLYRQMPLQQEDIVLWVRSDLMLEPPNSNLIP
jgi:hypothetical protein